MCKNLSSILVLISSYADQATPTLATCPVNGLDFEGTSKVFKAKCSDDGKYTISYYCIFSLDWDKH